VDFEKVAPPLVKPCQNEDLLPGGKAIHGICKSRVDLKPGFRAAFVALPGTFFEGLERRSYDSDGKEEKAGFCHWLFFSLIAPRELPPDAAFSAAGDA
jgi:hypothetical protein